eukprot:contig_4190_g914
MNKCRPVNPTRTGKLLEPAHATNITKVVPNGDLRPKMARFQGAAIKEVGGLRDRDTFKKVKLTDVPENANVI